MQKTFTIYGVKKESDSTCPYIATFEVSREDLQMWHETTGINYHLTQDMNTAKQLRDNN